MTDNLGSMTPIVPGASSETATAVYTPPVVTALSLPEYAEIMGINPIQFMSGNATGFFPSTGCTDKWQQYAWQDEHKASRDELAREILQAERDIANQLGYWPGPKWVEDELVNYPKFYKRAWTTVSGANVAGYYKSIRLKYGRFVAGGVRNPEYITSATFSAGSMTLSDEDGDGYKETVFVSVNTSYTSPYEHKVFFADKDGRPEWEIRPVNTKVLSGGILEMRIPVQLLFKPQLLAQLPGETGVPDIDPTNEDNLVEAVDIYYVTPDPSQGSLFHWNESILMRDDTVHTTQLAALEPKVTHRVADEVTVTPATYDAATGKYTVVPFTIAREPDYVELAYLSGAYEVDYRRGAHRVPTDLATAITYIATARLSRPLCHRCETVKAKEDRLKTELSYTADGDTGSIRFVTPTVLRNPFGTKVGEVEAWNIVKTRIDEGDLSARSAAF